MKTTGKSTAKARRKLREAETLACAAREILEPVIRCEGMTEACAAVELLGLLQERLHKVRKSLGPAGPKVARKTA